MINDLLIEKSATIKDCLKQLDKTAMRVLYVVDEKRMLVGALSDGDLRRAILAGRNLEDTIEQVYNPHPVRITRGTPKEEIKFLFLEKRVESIPVVNEQGTVESVLDWEAFFGEKAQKECPALDIPVVLMAGGKGTRLAPFTNVLPKPLIPIGEKTIMELIIDEFRTYRIKDYYFTLNYRGQMIEAYFNSLDKDYRTINLWEKEFEGTAGSLKLLPLKDIKDDFILSNCDVIVKAEYDKALQHHRESGAMVTVLSSIQHYKIPYGVIDFKENGEVVGLKEKPEYSFPINTGVYIVNKNALAHIPGGQVFHMTHLMESLIENGEKVVTYPVNENDYIDIGQWDEYRAAIDRLKV